MDYWHLQMHLPGNREGKEIDIHAMLNEPQPVIGTSDWEALDCQYFKGEHDGLHVGSIIMVRRGSEPIALCKIVSEYFRDQTLESKYLHALYRYVEILDYNTIEKKDTRLTQGTLGRLYESKNTDSWNYINDWYQKIIAMIDLNKCVDILKFKRQIILQGPPGTGKTRLADEIAKELIESEPTDISTHSINTLDITSIIVPGLIINSAKNITTFTVQTILNHTVLLAVRNSNKTSYEANFTDIISAYEEKIWTTNKGNTYSAGVIALAKYIHYYKKKEAQCKLIQFHPSYSYEDLVRGIVAESNDGQIEYKNVNKLLGKFAEEANQNYIDSQKDETSISKENQIRAHFEQFADGLNEKIAQEGFIKLTPKVNIFEVEEDALRYKGNEGWTALGNRMLFKDIIQAYLDENKTRQDIKKNKNLSGLAIQHASYFVRVLNMFQEYLQKQNLKSRQVESHRIELKNYVLIIDEINRANLSSVLGELIYALEYRGEKVESMYAIDGKTEFVLPPNLYIIGTMNTADRSVGHIDYAIRRRFAFIDVLPQDLSHELKGRFHKELFDKVARLFYTNRSQEFEIKDVQLGHSYFIDKSEDGGTMQIRLEYEIKPILREYIKDGILIGEGIKDIIDALSV